MSSSTDETEPGTGPAWRWGLGILAARSCSSASSRPSPARRGLSVQTAAVRRGDLLVPVQCDGTLEPPPGGELRAADAATVAELFAKDGDRVRSGAPLVRLENTELSRTALDARSEALRLEARARRGRGGRERPRAAGEARGAGVRGGRAPALERRDHAHDLRAGRARSRPGARSVARGAGAADGARRRGQGRRVPRRARPAGRRPISSAASPP